MYLLYRLTQTKPTEDAEIAGFWVRRRHFRVSKKTEDLQATIHKQTIVTANNYPPTFVKDYHSPYRHAPKSVDYRRST